MTPNKRLNNLLADDGSQHAQAAVEWLQSISLIQKSKIYFPCLQVRANPVGFWARRSL